MKIYNKVQHTGNENGWSDEGKIVGQTIVTERVSEELNSHFRNTGMKYVDSGETTGDDINNVNGAHIKTGDDAGDGKTYQPVTAEFLAEHPDVTGVRVGDLYPM